MGNVLWLECSICGSLLEREILNAGSDPHGTDEFYRVNPCAICEANRRIEDAATAAEVPTVYVLDAYYGDEIRLELDTESMEISIEPVDMDGDRMGDPEVLIPTSQLMEALDYLAKQAAV